MGAVANVPIVSAMSATDEDEEVADAFLSDTSSSLTAKVDEELTRVDLFCLSSSLVSGFCRLVIVFLLLLIWSMCEFELVLTRLDFLPALFALDVIVDVVVVEMEPLLIAADK